MRLTWATEIAVWLDELRDYPRVAKRVSQVLKWADRVHRDRMSGSDPGIHLDDEFPPRRGLKVWEKYELVLAIHRAYASAPPIKRRESRTYWRKRGTGDLVDNAIYQWSLCVPRLGDNHFGQVQRIVCAVCADLKVKPPELTRPATARTTIKVVNAQTQNVVVVQRDSKAKKRTGPKRNRKPREGFTDREKEWADLRDRGFSIADIRRTMGDISRARYYQLKTVVEQKEARLKLKSRSPAVVTGLLDGRSPTRNPQKSSRIAGQRISEESDD